MDTTIVGSTTNRMTQNPVFLSGVMYPVLGAKLFRPIGMVS